MKALLRLRGKIRPETKLSAIGYLPSEFSCQPSGLSNQSSALNGRLPTQYLLSPNTYKRIPLILFILVFVSCGAAMAQEHGVHTAPAAQAESEIIPLKIGDKIPEELWDLPLQVINHPEGKESITLNDYRGKLIILDFWATWCGSCIEAMPKNYSLQERFLDSLIIIPVTNQSKATVISFLNKNSKLKGIDLHTITDDSLLRKAFPHKMVPHYVWISSSGKVRAITYPEDVNRENIINAINDNQFLSYTKADLLEYDLNKPLTQRNYEVLNKSLISQSFLSWYVPGIPSSFGSETDSVNNTRRLYATNVSIPMLFLNTDSEAKSIPKERWLYHTARNEELVAPTNPIDKADWNRSNMYCYEYIVPLVSASDGKREARKNLEDIFGITAEIESKILDCFALRQSEKEVVDNKEGLSGYQIVKYLNNIIDFPYLLDETDSGQRFNVSLELLSGDIESLNIRLKEYGLKLEKVKRELNFLIFKDRTHGI